MVYGDEVFIAIIFKNYSQWNERVSFASRGKISS